MEKDSLDDLDFESEWTKFKDAIGHREFYSGSTNGGMTFIIGIGTKYTMPPSITINEKVLAILKELKLIIPVSIDNGTFRIDPTGDV